MKEDLKINWEIWDMQTNNNANEILNAAIDAERTFKYREPYILDSLTHSL